MSDDLNVIHSSTFIQLTLNAFHIFLTHTYTHIYISEKISFIVGPKREKYFKMNKSTKRFVFFKESFIYFVLRYVYVSSWLLSSKNIYGTRLWEWGTH